MANDQAIAVRREKVKRRLLRGMSTQEIADDLHVSVRTVQMDIQAVRDSGSLALSKLDAREFIAMAASKQDELERESWFVYYAAQSSQSDKLRALKNIQDIAKDRLEMYQAIGLVPSVDKGGVNIAIGVVTERCANCPYKDHYTRTEMRDVMATEVVENEAATQNQVGPDN